MSRGTKPRTLLGSMWRCIGVPLGMLVSGCSSSDPLPPGAHGGGGGVASGGTGGARAGGTVGSSSGGRTSSGGALGGATTTGGASVGGASTAGSSGSGGYSRVGVCGQRGKATADATAFKGYEERFMISDEGLGEDVCVVRFDLERVGNAPPGCGACQWTHLLEYQNPSVLIDVEGACEKSELGLDLLEIAKLTGSRTAVGFAPELDGAHGSARMAYFGTTMMWDVYGNATWEDATKAFRYDHRDGFCNY